MQNDGRHATPDQFADATWLDVQAMISEFRTDLDRAAQKVGPGNPGVQAMVRSTHIRLEEIQARIAEGEAIYFAKVSARITTGRRRNKGEGDPAT